PATLAAQKGHHFSLLQLPPSIRRAQARLAVQDNDTLLLGGGGVVGIGGFAGRQLPQAQPQPVASGLAADAGALTPKAGVLARFIEDGIVDVRHARSLS